MLMMMQSGSINARTMPVQSLYNAHTHLVAYGADEADAGHIGIHLPDVHLWCISDGGDDALEWHTNTGLTEHAGRVGVAKRQAWSGNSCK